MGDPLAIPIPRIGWNREGGGIPRQELLEMVRPGASEPKKRRYALLNRITYVRNCNRGSCGEPKTKYSALLK